MGCRLGAVPLRPVLVNARTGHAATVTIAVNMKSQIEYKINSLTKINLNRISNHLSHLVTGVSHSAASFAAAAAVAAHAADCYKSQRKTRIYKSQAFRHPSNEKRLSNAHCNLYCNLHFLLSCPLPRALCPNMPTPSPRASKTSLRESPSLEQVKPRPICKSNTNLDVRLVALLENTLLRLSSRLESTQLQLLLALAAQTSFLLVLRWLRSTITMKLPS